MNEKKQRFFDQYASSVHHLNSPEAIARIGSIIDDLEIKKGEKIADLGCGDGVLFPLLLPRIGIEGLLCGFDFSSKMLMQARHLYSAPNLEIILADVHTLPVSSRFFDRVICFASFAHFDKKEGAIHEISRILRADGSLHIIHLLSSQEIAHHHKGDGLPIDHDVLPDQSSFSKMIADGGMVPLKYVDQPGLFHFSAKKIQP